LQCGVNRYFSKEKTFKPELKIEMLKSEIYCIEYAYCSLSDAVFSHSEMSWRKNPVENLENWFR
jgi:hypothetical protein